MDSEQRRALLAVILSGIVLFAWQYFFVPKSSLNSSIPNSSKEAQPLVLNGQETKQVVQPALANSVDPSVGSDFKIELRNKDSLFLIDNLFNVINFSVPYQGTDFSKVVGSNFKFYISNGNSKLQIKNFTQQNPSLVSGELRDGGTFSLYLQDNGKVQYKFSFLNPVALNFSLISSHEKNQSNKERSLILFGKDVKFHIVGNESSDESKYKWFGIDHDYHVFLMTLKNPLTMKTQTSLDGSSLLSMGAPTNEIEGEFIFSKKNYDTLLSLGSSLELSVDFGLLGIVAVPILRGLQFFHRYVPNYGLAIILLTIVIRLLTFPLQYKSFVSMKKMQVLQPELTKLKERFKDDPQRMQKETMELFKRSGANPLGGCLPLIMQMPIFFAFYRVLYAAVELVGSPFFGWIHDLSIKDPFFVLPLIMVVLMLLQQKLTPSTTADPMQQKVMMFMPIIFGFIMKDLPSGLVLYICVSTLIGILQQMLVFKTTK